MLLFHQKITNTVICNLLKPTHLDEKFTLKINDNVQDNRPLVWHVQLTHLATDPKTFSQPPDYQRRVFHSCRLLKIGLSVESRKVVGPFCTACGLHQTSCGGPAPTSTFRSRKMNIFAPLYRNGAFCAVSLRISSWVWWWCNLTTRGRGRLQSVGLGPNAWCTLSTKILFVTFSFTKSFGINSEIKPTELPFSKPSATPSILMFCLLD